MKNITEFIKKRLLSLPPEIQKAFSETDIVGEIEKIRINHKLMYDQASVLESETMLVFLGLEEPKHLLGNISKNANITTEMAGQIVDEIEKNILKQIKSKLVETLEKEDEESKKGNVDQDQFETLETKEALLNEIENPTPTFVTKKEIAPEIPNKSLILEPNKTIQAFTPQITPTRSIVEQKLSEPTRIPPKEIEVSLKKLPQTPAQTITTPKIYSADPYKEPIV